MKKSIVAITVISSLFTGSALANDLGNVERVISSTSTTQNIISGKVNDLNTYQFIVKFSDNVTHKSLIQTPETNSMLIERQKSDVNSMSIDGIQALGERDFISKYNLNEKIESPQGLQTIETIERDLGVTIKHIRSLAMGRDLIEVSTSLSADAMLKLMKNHSSLAEVTPNTLMKTNAYSAVDYNDPRSVDQAYFNNQGENIANGNFAKMKTVAENNLGRTVRVGIVDSGSWQHDDMKPVPSGIEGGYDFITYMNSSNSQLRSENHQDGVTVNGAVETVGHGIAVASTLGAITDNAKGMVGVANSDDIDFIFAKVCSPFGCSNADVNDAVFWLAGGSLVGVPNIATPVDVINMSLAGFNYGGCSSYRQEVINFAYDAGITIVVGAGNDNLSADNVSPAACENVITVGALTRDFGGDKSGFSNYGDKIDLSTIGSDVVTAKLDNTHSAYQVSSGTSFSSPIVAGVVATLKLKYPALTNAQIERILKQSSYKITSSNNSKDCEIYGCGAGSLDAYEAVMSIENILTTNTAKVEHLYQNADDFYVAEMNKFKNVCNLQKVSIGSIGSQLDGVEYKVFTGANNELYTVTVDPIIVVDTVDTISYQACVNGDCGDINEIYAASITKPSFCQ